MAFVMESLLSRLLRHLLPQRPVPPVDEVTLDVHEARLVIPDVLVSLGGQEAVVECASGSPGP